MRKTRKNDKDQYVLSVFWNGPKHFILNRDKREHWCLEGPSFPEVPELVDYYFKKNKPVTGSSNCILIRPVKRERWQLDNEDIEKEEMMGKVGCASFWKFFWVYEQSESRVSEARWYFSETVSFSFAAASS